MGSPVIEKLEGLCLLRVQEYNCLTTQLKGGLLLYCWENVKGLM